MRANEDPYRTLGIAPDATVEQIKLAYRKAAMRWHPDVSKAERAKSEREFRLVTDAYKRVLRKALLDARKARTSHRVQGTSSGPGRWEPRAGRCYYTPPTPPHGQGVAKPHLPRRRSRLGWELRFVWRDARTTLLVMLWLVLLLAFVVWLDIYGSVLHLIWTDPEMAFVHIDPETGPSMTVVRIGRNIGKENRMALHDWRYLVACCYLVVVCGLTFWLWKLPKLIIRRDIRGRRKRR